MLLDEVVLFNHSEISPEDFDVSRTVWRFAWGMCVLGWGGRFPVRPAVPLLTLLASPSQKGCWTLVSPSL